MKQLPILVLKGCLLMGAFLCGLHVPSIFGGRAGPRGCSSSPEEVGFLLSVMTVSALVVGVVIVL